MAEQRVTLLETYLRAVDEFGRRVDGVGSDQWDNPTPCTEWDVRTLLNHVVVEELWAPHLLAKQTLEEVGDRYDGDVLGDDPKARWHQAATGARDAARTPGALEGKVHVSWGRSAPRTT